MARLHGKVALISGAGAGMGRAHALRLASEGARVVATDIDEAAARHTAEMVVKAGGQSVSFRHDVAQSSDWARVVAASMQCYGKVDVLVNNAGILLFKSVEQTDEEEWERVMAVNAKSIYLGCKHVVPAMVAAGGGSIINVSSAYGLVGASGCAAYIASKGASRLLTKAAAADLHKFAIRVNSLHPGLVRTEMTKDILANPESTRLALGSAIFDRAAEPDEIAAAVLFLASDDSSYMTGSEVIVDGGMSAR